MVVFKKVQKFVNFFIFSLFDLLLRHGPQRLFGFFLELLSSSLLPLVLHIQFSEVIKIELSLFGLRRLIVKHIEDLSGSLLILFLHFLSSFSISLPLLPDFSESLLILLLPLFDVSLGLMDMILEFIQPFLVLIDSPCLLFFIASDILEWTF